MRRWAIAALTALTFVVLLIGAAAWRDITTARVQFDDARAQFTAVLEDPQSLRMAEGRASALTSLREASRRLASVQKRVSNSLPLNLTSAVPQIGRQRAGVLALTDDARSGVEISRRLLREIDALASRTALSDGTVPLGGLEDLAQVLRRASSSMNSIRGGSAGLWDGLARTRRRLDDLAARTANALLSGADATVATRTFLGSERPRRYLVAVQNNAEMRDQGMVLSYAVVSFVSGRMTVERIGPITSLSLEHAVDIVLPDGTEKMFGSQQPLRLWQNTNATADWPLSARTMAAMFRQAGGGEVDGVIALDVPALAAILRVVGPVPNPAGGAEISSANASEVLLHDFYSQVPRGEQTARKERQAEVAAAVIARLSSGRHDVVALARELGVAASGGHFRLWSKDSAEERTFRRTGLGGGPAEKLADRTLHLSVQNASSTKLDYFQRQRVRMDVYITEARTAVIRTSVTLVNTVPKNAAPSYQLGPSGATQETPGQYPARIYFWGPRGGAQAQGIPESGLSLNYSSALVEPSESETVVFHTAIRNAIRDDRLELRLVPQPILVPANLEIELHAPGWSVEGETSLSQLWDRTITVRWGLKS